MISKVAQKASVFVQRASEQIAAAEAPDFVRLQGIHSQSCLTDQPAYLPVPN